MHMTTQTKSVHENFTTLCPYFTQWIAKKYRRFALFFYW